MAKKALDNLLRCLPRLATGQVAAGLANQHLLERFVHEHDEAAFAALLERHGQMVLGVCRRALHDEHLAEDVLQATFLVLARNAGTIRKGLSLSSWLHGVALRLAHKAKAEAARAARGDARPTLEPPPGPVADASWREVRQILDDELQRLPESYRLPLILCYLEGRTRDEAAAELGWTPARLKGLLERGRERLRGRLIRRGLASAAAEAALLTETALAAPVEPLLAVATLRIALRLAAGEVLSASAVSATVLGLTKVGLGIMESKKALLFLTLALALGVLGTGAALLAQRRSPVASAGSAQEPVAPVPPAPLGATPVTNEEDKHRAQGDKTKTDLEKLQGTWEPIAREYEGKAMPSNGPEWWIFEDDNLQRAFVMSSFVSKFSLDSTKDQKRLTIITKVGPPGQDVEVPCIYKLEGDMLTLCFDGEGKDPKKRQPKEFTGKAGAGMMLLVLKRLPPKAQLKPDKDKLKDEKEALQGVWRVDSVAVAGKDATDKWAGTVREWVVKDSVIRFRNGLTEDSSPYKLDPNKKPKEIDITPTLPGYSVKRDRGPPNRGVYSLDGDVWKVCFPRGTYLQGSPADGRDRPKEVASKKEFAGEDDGTILVTLKRVKPDKDKPKNDKEALQGVWRVDSVTVGGKEATDKWPKNMQEWAVKPVGYDFADAAVECQTKGAGEPGTSCWLKLGSGEMPRDIDFILMTLGEPLPHRAVYSLEGDVWKVCLPRGTKLEADRPKAQDRPKGLASTEANGTILITLKRVKRDEAKPKDEKAAAWREKATFKVVSQPESWWKPGGLFPTFVQFSPDGKRLATARLGYPRTFTLLDAASGKDLSDQSNFGDRRSEDQFGGFTPDGKAWGIREVASGPALVGFALVDWDSGQERSRVTEKGWRAALSPDGKVLAGINHDGKLKLWDAGTGKARGGLADSPDEYFSGLAFSPDGKTLATASFPRNLLQSFVQHAPDDYRAYVALWDVATGKVIASRTLVGEEAALGTPSSPSGNEAARSMRFTPDGRRLAIACNLVLPGQPYLQTVLRVWDVKGLKEGRQLQSEEHGSLRDYSFSPDGKTVAVAWIGATKSSGPGETTVYAPAPVTILDLATGKEVARIAPPRSGYAAVAFSRDGTLLATQDNEGVVKVWDRTSPK